MRFEYFLEGPLLQFAILTLTVSILVRLGLYAYSIMRAGKNTGQKSVPVLLRFRRLLLRFREVVSLRHFLAALPVYLFHLCIIILPVWTLGHVVLWEESRLGWSWAALPDKWSDGMTLSVIFLSGCFLVRRIVLLTVYHEGHIADCFLIITTALPFGTGYFLAHGSPGFMPIPADDMWTIHVLTGEIVMFTAAALFCRVRLDDRRCMGCAACGLVCPTRALDARDHKHLRSLSYCLSQCICCGICRQACPEKAIRMKHDISLKRFLLMFSREELYMTELVSCEMCQKPVASMNQVRKIGEAIGEPVCLCESCKRIKQSTRWYGVMAGG